MDPIKFNQAIAYKGKIGRLRAQFCIRYIENKRQALKEVERDLGAKVKADKKVITCGCGCALCCYLFVQASLQECEAVVYRLYSQPRATADFLQRFESWCSQVGQIESAFKTIVALGNKTLAPGSSEFEMLNKSSLRYRLKNIACPFLVDNSCSIYDIRPWVCAGVVATTPREWCEPANTNYQKADLHFAEAYLTREQQYFLPVKPGIAQGCFPVRVYELLKNGYGSLALISGLTDLEARVLADPEVIEVKRGLS
jgi:hypothetical protein